MFNNHQVTNYRLANSMANGSTVNNATFNHIHSPGFSSTYLNSPQITNQQYSVPNSMDYSTNPILANQSHSGLLNNASIDSHSEVQNTLQTNFQTNQLMQTNPNLSNRESTSISNNLPRMPLTISSQQHMLAQRLIKREPNVDSADQSQQSMHSNQQVTLLNNIGNANDSMQLDNNYVNISYNVERNMNRDSNIYNVHNNLPLMNTQLTNQMQMSNQCRYTNFTNNQLTDHLNIPKNQLKMSLQPTIEHNNSMTNVMGHELQLQSGLIIRPTFNNDLAVFQPINMEDQERYKQERKRQRNREAATKCRLKKIQKMRQLELNAELLSKDVENLVKIANDSLMQVNELKFQVMTHINSGCNINMNECCLVNQFANVNLSSERDQSNNEENTSLSNSLQSSFQHSIKNQSGNNIQNQINEIQDKHLCEHNYTTNYQIVDDQLKDEQINYEAIQKFN